MKGIKYLLVIASFLFSACAVSSQVFDPGKKFPVEQLQEDFKTLRKLLEENHPALYRYDDEAFFRNYFDSTYLLIKREMTELEFIKVLDPMIAKIHCGHTELWYSKEFEDHVYDHNLFIPLSVYYIHDRAYIRRQYTEGIPPLEGLEIISINGEPVSRILKMLYSSMNGDGYITQNILYTINKIPVSILSRYFNYTGAYRFQVFKPGDSTTSEICLKGIKYKDLIAISDQRYPRGAADKDFDFRILDSLNTAVIRIRSFIKSSNDGYFEFLKASFTRMDEQHLDKLILDVRGNDGGHPDYAIELLKYLMDEGFLYFKTPTSNPLWNDPIVPYSNNYKGDLYVLTDGGELSTTGHFISLIKFHKLGKFVGQESGSTFSCHDNSLEFVLPNTKIRGKVARTTFETAVKGFNPDRGIMPDYYVEPRIEDIIRDKDTTMEYTLKLISNKAHVHKQLLNFIFSIFKV